MIARSQIQRSLLQKQKSIYRSQCGAKIVPKFKNMSPRFKLIWLSICVVLVYGIIIVGGYTRLSHAGLSIVQWQPISGILPPLSEASWQVEFINYQASPEYQKINHGMTVTEFKQIFYIEYIHRLLGRLIGLVFLLPLIYCWRKLPHGERKYFSYIVALIGFQGLVGWLMVKSGLVDRPNVSQYRLALHLCLACIIVALLVFKITPGNSRQSKYAYFSLGLLFFQIASGAFVAGLNAGLVYNSFPLMDGELIPFGLGLMKPYYLNFFENLTMVQFIHRNLAILNLLNIIIYSYLIFKLDGKKKTAIILAGLILLQFMLGVVTLIFQAPLILALLHQTVAIALLITLVISLKGKVDA